MIIEMRVFLLAVMAVCICAISAPPASAQNSTSLEAEIQNMEKIAARQGVPPKERHDALVRLAHIRQLSGDIEGAARNWLDAAAAIPGQVDDDALLSCAYCLAAMGEWDRARTALEPLLAKSARARFLQYCINAVSTGNTSALAAIADNPEYSQMKSEIYFLLWRTSAGPAAERWRQRLVSEFPQSPEGRLASVESHAEGETSAAVTILPGPFWLFMGGLDSLPLMESETTGRPSQRIGSAEQAAGTQGAAQTTAASAPSAPVQSAAQTPVSFARLQTGIFGQQANAQAQAASLRQAGFTPTIEERTIGSSEMWAVTVPTGADQNRTIRQLRDAGFDAFPLR